MGSPAKEKDAPASSMKVQTGKGNKKKGQEKDKKQEEPEKSQKLTPEQILEKIKPKVEEQLKKSSPIISKTATVELINEIFPNPVFFGCPEGKQLTDIETMKKEAKNYYDTSRPLINCIASNPAQYVAETKAGHASDFLTYLQSDKRPFPVKAQKNPEAEKIDKAEQKQLEESNFRARGIYIFC